MNARELDADGRWRDPSVDPWPKCACGCGQDAPAARWTDNKRGAKRGHPQRWRRGHTTDKGIKADFTTHVDPDTGCVLFNAWSPDGKPLPYRSIWHNGRAQPASRVWYERAHGPIAPHMHVHHLCENPPCVNLEHLELIRDGDHTRLHRADKPCLTTRSRLTVAEIEDIRSSEEPDRVVAERYGFTKTYIQAIRRGHAPKHPADEQVAA